ncbi:HvfC/BufC family peptide modification chaperone [Nitratifractor sp.]
MKQERKLLEDFFKAIFTGDESRFPNASIYKKLIYYRYEDVLAGTYPRYRAMLNEKKWKRLVEAYISTGIRTPYLWQMPEAFVDFASKREKKRKRLLQDLLWFEWIELELMMEPECDKGSNNFDFEASYKLGRCSRLKKLRYPVIYEDESLETLKEEKGKYPLLLYREKNEIRWEILTPYLYKLLKRCDGTRSLKKIVKSLAKEYGIGVKESKKVLKKVLKEYIKSGILIRVSKN